ncbi:MAG: phage tail sheath family protein [Planctomycetes bacterium]|nr:phage tail sheath family protein [Planctomycetota bacterium]
MSTYLHPGVYIEEIPSGSRPIEGVSTAIAAFVGSVSQGPVANRPPDNETVLIHSFEDYVEKFGAVERKDDLMGLAVSAYFQNGGKDAYIARLAGAAPPAKAATNGVLGEASGTEDVLTITASSVGQWGDDYYFRIIKEKATDLEFELQIGPRQDGKFVAEETFKGLTMDEEDDDYFSKRISGASALVKVAITDAVAGLLQRGSLTGGDVTGAADVFTNGLVDGMTMKVHVDELGGKAITLGDPAAAVADGGLGLTGANEADGGRVAAAIETAVGDLGPQESYAAFTCTYDAAAHSFTLISGKASSGSRVKVTPSATDATDLVTALALTAELASASVHGTARVIPKATDSIDAQGVKLEGGAYGEPSDDDYKTYFASRLVKFRDASIIVLPGKHLNAGGHPVVDAAVAHCEATGNRMVIVDPPPDEEFESKTDFQDLSGPTSTYSVLYYPWVDVPNPEYDAEKKPNEPVTVTIAPSAFAAGQWARTDGRRGVWKAPAGVQVQLSGVSSLQFDVGEGEQDQLNPVGVNCLRKLPGFGRVIWGSRTLATKADPEWRYVPVRRTAIMIEESIYSGIQWAVFEPNNHLLWSSLRLNIQNFMDGLFRAGAFQGKKASDAFFVRCGLGDTMKQSDIDAGQVIVIVGFAPLKPAEFVIVRIQQKVGQN